MAQSTHRTQRNPKILTGVCSSVFDLLNTAVCAEGHRQSQKPSSSGNWCVRRYSSKRWFLRISPKVVSSVIRL